MSKLHLLALEDALAQEGWRIVATHHGDNYRISGSWEIQRSSRQSTVFIDFDGMGPNGDYCLPLSESYGCQVRGQQSISLYFRRINRSRRLWRQELAAFVQVLNRGNEVKRRNRTKLNPEPTHN